MAGSLYGCMLTCVIILAANVVRYGATQIDLGNGFRVLSKREYSEMINANNLSHRKGVVQCNFDNGWCGFRNDIGDNFDWMLRSRSTPSLQTGPSSDISGKGSYVYIETSRPRRSGHRARLLTPVLPATDYCLQFAFHAYGKDIGALVVYKKDSSPTKELLLKLEKNYGNRWLYVVGTVRHHSDYQIEFEGVCGKGYRGDIALDSVTITAGMCYGSGESITEECGYGYSGVSSGISTFPPLSAWPWMVGLSSSRQAKVLCSGVQVSSNWVLTSRTCAQKFTKLDIATYNGNENVERRKVVKSKQHPSKTSETVLLQLNNSKSKRAINKVCLPPSIDLSTVGRSQEVCYLLAASFASYGNIFKDSTVSILSTDECTRHLRSILWKHHDKRQLLCVQPVSGFNSTTAEYDGYVICKNKILQRWILLAVGSFSYRNMTNEQPLVFTQVSSVVDWIEKIVNVTILVPKPPSAIAVPNPTKEPLRGFQIFEQTEQKCLTLISRKTGRFTYQKCNIYDISQRFEWSSQNQIVILTTNRCLMVDFIPYYYLGSARCSATKKSQKWMCLGNRIENEFHRKWFIGFGLAKKGWVHLINVRDQQRRGNFVVYGTDATLCSNRKTVSGDFRCGVHRGPMCGFDNLNHISQLIWIIWKPNPSEISEVFSGLQSSDTIFKTAIRRGYGDKTAVLTTPWFHGQRCVQFYSYLHGLPFNQLTIHKYERGRSQMILRINGGHKKQWLFHRVTLSPKQCETYQVLFKAFLPTGGTNKVGLRDVKVLNGACEPIATPNKKNGKCLKGWKFVNGSCFFPYDVKTSWNQALAVCQITGADLPTDTVASKLVPRGAPSWFGIRRCPNGRWYSTQAVQYFFKRSSIVSHAICVQIHFPATPGPVYRSASCDTKVPFVCQKDPKKTENGCGLMNSSISNEPSSSVVNADRQWPWHVCIVVFTKCECGGTLVAPGYIVTSNLCVTRVLLRDIKIFIPSSRFVIRRVKKVIYNPKFGHKSGDNDVAIIMFDEHFLSSLPMQFACVNKMTKIWEERKSSKSDLLKDTKCFVVGWGTYRGGFGTCGPNNYRIHEVEILDKTQCDAYYGKGIMTEKMLCVRPRNQGTRSCLGDTGGPLVCEIAGAWTLMGVTTWGAGCTTTRKYGIYTDIASMKPWMDAVTEVKTQQSIYNS